jgi:hypothetical protein
MLRLRLFAALASLFLVPAAVPAPAREPNALQTKVPRWDARGVGPLAWQGVACLDVNDDATRIAHGTIAPAGDPNVLLLDGNGKVLRQERAGQRWINQVAFGTDDMLRVARGVLGTSGSFNFSARDVLASLRKLQALKPDAVLPDSGALVRCVFGIPFQSIFQQVGGIIRPAAGHHASGPSNRPGSALGARQRQVSKKTVRPSTGSPVEWSLS